MPEYRYMGVDLLTRQVVEDLPLYGVSLSRQISGAGNMTGSFKLGTGEFSDSDLLNASEPGLRALYVLRDNFLIWAGPIWSRTYQSQASVCSLTGQTYESVFAQMEVLSRFKRVNIDQLIIFKDLVDLMQDQVSSDFGFDTSEIGTSGVLASLTVDTFEHKMFSEPIDDLLKAAGSFDYMVDYTFDPSSEAVALKIKTGYPYLGFGQAGINLDYPGSITNYYYPESAGRGTVRLNVLGTGQGSAMAYAVATHNDLLAAGYPAWGMNHAEKGVRNRAQLARIAEETARVLKMPVTNPTVEFNIDEAIDFSEWNNFGVPVNIHVEDARFPDGKDFTRRMIGWDYQPADSSTTEALKMVVEGSEDI
jgi:hypothetical protein